MADLGEEAAAIEAEVIARGLSRILADIPAGQPGECDNCGEEMPRLVEGRCGFCRDGRRRPPTHYAAAPRPVAPNPNQTEEPVSNPGTQPITVHLKGAVLDAVRTRAADDKVPLATAAREIMEGVLDPPILPEQFPTESLLAELAARLAASAPAGEIAAANARAETAEARLAEIERVLRG